MGCGAFFYVLLGWLWGKQGSLIPPRAWCSHQGAAVEGQSSIAGSCFNFVNSIIGAGIIGIPYALDEGGFVLGLFLLLVR